jgi:glycosyltransferase involved in cell wall biosynthesis
VGEGPRRAFLEERAVEGVTLFGNTDDPRDWYAAANVVVVPSRWEGMALVPLEAAASARPVVMTDVAGAREAVPAGTGEVVPPEDHIALASAVIRRLEDLDVAAREGRAARRHVVSSYALMANGSRMQWVYESVLSARSAPKG